MVNYGPKERAAQILTQKIIPSNVNEMEILEYPDVNDIAKVGKVEPQNHSSVSNISHRPMMKKLKLEANRDRVLADPSLFSRYVKSLYPFTLFPLYDITALSCARPVREPSQITFAFFGI